MKRAILDTNVYGIIVDRREGRLIREKLIKKRAAVIYGSRIIRKELRETPRNLRDKVEGRKLRILLLGLYDDLVKHSVEVIGATKRLADEYFEEYKKLGGALGREALNNDFNIVACAAFYNLDIVSEDEKTMRSELALRAYSTVNRKNMLRTPEFIGYKDFRKLLTL